jgi:hypothetical protein
MTISTSIEQVLDEAGKMVNDGIETDKIRSYLSNAGMDKQSIESLIHQLKSQLYLKRRKRGFTFGIIGSIMLVIGFLLTVLFYHSGISIHFVMYGMTSVGVILLLIGMIDILGW